METNAVGLAGETCGVEKSFGARLVQGVLGDVGFVGPVRWWKDGVGDLRLAMEKIADERGTIGGVGKGLADLYLFQYRVFEIQTQVGEVYAGALGYAEMGLFCEDGDHVGSQ